MGLRDALTPELHAAAETDGVSDIPTVWLKFCAHMVARWPGVPKNVETEWQFFYARERSYQSTTRAREARIAEEQRARLAKVQEARHCPPPVTVRPEDEIQPHDLARFERARLKANGGT